MNEQQVKDYAVKHLSGLDVDRVIQVSGVNDYWAISFSDQEGNRLRGGYFFLVQKTTGDVLNMGRLGSGMGYTTLDSCIRKFYDDGDFRTLLKMFGVIIGNVMEDTYVK